MNSFYHKLLKKCAYELREATSEIELNDTQREVLNDFLESLTTEDYFSYYVPFNKFNEVKMPVEVIDLLENQWITASEAQELREIIAELRVTLEAETQGKIAFIVKDKRLDVNKLLSNISSLMAPGVFDKLPEIARYDFTQAGKCIAFELPTSAAFHILRATEATLRHFYLSVTSEHTKQNWGPIVQSLKEWIDPLPKPLLDNLDNIRHNFRNPTQHPEKIYDIEEVQDLFGLCVDVVNRMVRSEIWFVMKKDEA